MTLCVFRIIQVYVFSYSLQHATADVSLMLLGSKSDLDSRREVTHEDAEKVNC